MAHLAFEARMAELKGDGTAGAPHGRSRTVGAGNPGNGDSFRFLTGQFRRYPAGIAGRRLEFTKTAGAPDELFPYRSPKAPLFQGLGRILDTIDQERWIIAHRPAKPTGKRVWRRETAASHSSCHGRILLRRPQTRRGRVAFRTRQYGIRRRVWHDVHLSSLRGGPAHCAGPGQPASGCQLRRLTPILCHQDPTPAVRRGAQIADAGVQQASSFRGGNGLERNLWWLRQTGTRIVVRDFDGRVTETQSRGTILNR